MNKVLILINFSNAKHLQLKSVFVSKYDYSCWIISLKHKTFCAKYALENDLTFNFSFRKTENVKGFGQNHI